MTDQTEREALTSRAAVDAYPHRNPYMEGGAYMGEERSRIPLREAFVAGAKWADSNRTPTPHVVGDLGWFNADANSGDQERVTGSPHVVTTVTDFSEGVHAVVTGGQTVLVVDDGDGRVWVVDANGDKVPWRDGLTFPATVLTPAPAPVDREALEHRYNVTRVDGRSEPGEKHHGCRYFVLDLTHDPKAQALVDAYFGRAPEAVERVRAVALDVLDCEGGRTAESAGRITVAQWVLDAIEGVSRG